MNITPENIRYLCQSNAMYWTEHVHGQIIEYYEDDYPFPSCLIFLMIGTRPLHVVCSIGNGQLFIITAYAPNPTEWDTTFTKRRKEGGSS